jgi:molybdopterin-guanine dinucleotide biosynthesis protein A
MLIGSIVLAGGRSRRMGRAKEALPFRGSTLLGHVAETLLQCSYPVVVVGRDENQELPPLPLEVDVVHDRTPDLGPLAGIAAGMRRLEGDCDAAFVTACDTPFVGAAAIAWLAGLLGGHDLVIPRAGDLLQPMCSLWRVRVLARLEQALTAGKRAPKELVPELDARIVTEAEIDGFDPSRRFLLSIDTPEDYEAALRAGAS